MKFKIVFILTFISLMLLVCACGETEKIPATWTADVDGADFVIEFAEGRDIKILQLADIQLYPWQTLRSPGLRRSERENRIVSGVSDDMEITAWRYVEEAIERTDPDLIVLTGDNIAGTADDSGELWLDFIKRVDSYGIPWLCVYGNHDNESFIGAEWQSEQLLNSEYCIFANGEVTGNGNYNVLIKQGDEYKYILYSVDTHGEDLTNNLNVVHIDSETPHEGTIYEDQIQWLADSKKEIAANCGDVPAMMFCHIPIAPFYDAAIEKYGEACNVFPFYPDKDGDSGVLYEIGRGIDADGLWDTLKEINCKGVFMGHSHWMAASISYEGVLLTHGLKSSDEAFPNPMVGSTLITINEKDNSFDVEFVHTEYEIESKAAME